MSANTRLQTADVYIPNTDFRHKTLEVCPTKPNWLTDVKDTTAVQEEDRVVLWWPDGLCQVYTGDGIVKDFWPKPAMAHVIQTTPCGCCEPYTRFHRTGEVEQRFQGEPYYWGADTIREEPSNGYEITPILYLCDTDPYGWFMIYGKKVSFYLSDDSAYWGASCECTECFYEKRGH